MDTTSYKRQGGGRRLALTSNDGMTTSPDPHVYPTMVTPPAMLVTTKTLTDHCGGKTKEKGPSLPPPTMLPCYNVHHYGDENQHIATVSSFPVSQTGKEKLGEVQHVATAWVVQDKGKLWMVAVTDRRQTADLSIESFQPLGHLKTTPTSKNRQAYWLYFNA